MEARPTDLMDAGEPGREVVRLTLLRDGREVGSREVTRRRGVWEKLCRLATWEERHRPA